MKIRPVLLALATALLTATAAQAQNHFQQQIVTQFRNWAPRFQSQGLTPVGAPSTGSLRDDGDESLLVRLTAGTHYAIAGVCDADCSDIDLQVFATDGNKVGEDVANDEKPVVLFTAAYTGQYRVKVLMATCATDPCYYGVQVYSKAGVR